MTRAELEAEREKLIDECAKSWILWGTRLAQENRRACRIGEINMELEKMTTGPFPPHAGYYTPQDFGAVPDAPIRVGDEVTVRAKVRAVYEDGKVCVSVKENGYDVMILSEEIASHTPAPRPLKVGDRVASGSGRIWRIAAIDDDAAWCKSEDSGQRGTISLDVLTRIDGE
jgi:hypothetical protein